MKTWAVALLVAGAAAALFLFPSKEPEGRTGRPKAELGEDAPEPVDEPVLEEATGSPRQPGPADGLRPIKGRAFETVTDLRRFEEFFERTATGPVLDGASWEPGDEIPDGATLQFFAGKHEWRTRLLRNAPRFPAGLVVEGAGQEQTLLKVDTISTARAIHGLTFRDLTLDCGNRPLLDLRTPEPAAVRFANCRVLRFDSGAGSSAMIRAKNVAVHAIDSDFLGGYGKRPGFGRLFAVTNLLLARFERCTIRGPLLSVLSRSPNATHLFAACVFDDLDARLQPQLDRAASARFEACRFSFVERPSLEGKPLPGSWR